MAETQAQDSLKATLHLATILTSHNVADAKAVAARLMQRFGSLVHVLTPTSANQVRLTAGEGPAAAVAAFSAIMAFALTEQVAARPVISSCQAVHDHLRFTVGFDDIEHSRVLFLDAKNGLIADEILWSGTIDQSTVHGRELLRRALNLGAAALILVHNHPSGNPLPSTSDIALTRRIEQAARMLGIAVYDHIVVASTGTASMRAMGLI